jgi:RimJ/RimL family protein N-acetyltransferase
MDGARRVGPPERIVLVRLLLRRWTPEDAPALHEAAASAAVARRLGYRLDRIEEEPPDAPAERGRRMIWIMTCEAFADSAADLRARAAVA